MKYTLALIRDNGETASEMRPLGSFTTTEPDPGLENQLAIELFTRMSEVVSPPDLVALGAPVTYRPGKSPGRPSKIFVVSAMEHEAEVNTSVRLGGTYTSTELSHLLGYPFNRVTQVLSNLRTKRRELLANEPDPAERAKIEMEPVTGVLRGVSFHLLDETPGVDKID